MEIDKSISADTHIPIKSVKAVLSLLDEGATIPFIARYRKEVTGGLDEVKIIAVRDAAAVRRDLETRRRTILESLAERDLLNPELEERIRSAESKTALEDAYLPFRQKRKTRADTARKAGYGPLARQIFRNQDQAPDTRGFDDAEAALSGARDILAEQFNEDPDLRSALRLMTAEEGLLCSQVVAKKKDEDAAGVYRDYFDYEEVLSRVPSHRALAVLRGAREGVLRIKARVRDVRVLEWLERRLIRGSGPNSAQVKKAIGDSWKRLIAPSLENDALKELKDRSDDEAILVFAKNLRNMLLSPPLGQKALVAIDPGFRSGGKAAALDPQGNLKGFEVIHPEGSSAARESAIRTLNKLADSVRAEVFAVGNGTAGRETEEFIRTAFPQVPVISVDERGASVYSASQEARREFGDLDITVRGAVSIGRRLQDPLAELVKIEPAAIGVGQYQHDVDEGSLKSALNDVVVSAVNAVGAELNSASTALLSRVSGLGPKLAEAIVQKRRETGPYKSRSDLLQVPRLGAKVYEQCAGFLRITGSDNPLDATAVHPESYNIVRRMADKLDTTIQDLLDSSELRRRIRPEDLVEDLPGESSAGLPTIKDILAELERPGRDPRGSYEYFSFDDRVRSLDDIQEGMVLPGIVTNVTAFGAFVDVGAHRDGLVHISQMADRFVKDPNEVVSVNDQVEVKVLEVDRKRGRVSFSMKGFNA